MKSINRWPAIAIASLGAFTLLATAPSSSATPAPSTDLDFLEDTAVVYGEQSGGEGDGGSSTEGTMEGGNRVHVKKPSVYTTWAPFCADVIAGNIDLGCIADTASICDEFEVYATVYTYTDAEPVLIDTGNTRCIGPTETAATTADDPVRVILTASEFAALAIPASTIEMELNGFSLRNAHTNIYAASATRTLTTTILGQSVAVRAIPYEYRWNYGDGSTRTTTYPGSPVNGEPFETETATSHVYAETGDYPVGLTTVYTGQFSVAGGPWMPVAGMATVPSPGAEVSVWRTKKILVDSSCEENPNGPGCSSPFDE